MEALSLQTIAGYSGAALRQGDPAREIRAINSDSRTLQAGELFLALRGERFDGHAFLEQAIALGAAGAIVAEDCAAPPGFALIAAPDTLLAYQRIAREYRRSLPLRVIGITGSNGKTSTKDFTAAALGRRFRVLKTEGNFNNHIGVPRTLLRASREDEIAVVEIGMNHSGEIAPLADIAQPDVAIITNIGDAHLEFMLTREAIALEKGMLAEALSEAGCLILPAADPFTAGIAQRTRARAITVGFEQGDVRGAGFEQDLNGSRFTVTAEGESASVSIPAPGIHMAVNALLAIAAGLACGCPLSECATAISDAALTHGRLESKRVGDRQFLDDTYNANPDSMVAALETLAQMPATGRRVAVLGRMGELGPAADAGHRRVGEAAAQLRVDLLIGVGAEGVTITDAARAAGLNEALAVVSVDQAASLLARRTDPGDVILVKGSRSAGMERVIAAFSQLSAL